MTDFFEVDFGDGRKEKSPIASPEDRVTKAKQQIERAKKDGLAEMEKFDEAYKAFKEQTKGLILFKDATEQMEYAVEKMVNNVLRPILLGKEIYGMPEHAYNQIRKDIFKTLINHYEKRGK